MLHYGWKIPFVRPCCDQDILQKVFFLRSVYGVGMFLPGGTLTDRFAFTDKKNGPKGPFFLSFFVRKAAVPAALLRMGTPNTFTAPSLRTADIPAGNRHDTDQKKDQNNIHPFATLFPVRRIKTRTKVTIARIATRPATAGTGAKAAGAVRSVPTVYTRYAAM